MVTYSRHTFSNNKAIYKNEAFSYDNKKEGIMRYVFTVKLGPSSAQAPTKAGKSKLFSLPLPHK